MNKKVITKKNIIIFDIDSSSIAGALVQYGYIEKKELVSSVELFSVRKKITDTSEYSFEEFFKRTCKSLREVAQDVYLQSLISFDEIIVNVSTPWSSSQRRVLSHSAKKPFIFTRELSDELVEHDAEISFEKNLDYATHEVELIQRKNLEVYGNGYPMRKPIGKEVSDLALHSLTAVMSVDTKKIFTDIIEGVFHRTPQFISNTFVQYNEVRTLLPHIDNVVVLDISGEVTEVLVIMKDHLTHIGSVPVGTNGVMRHLSAELNVPLAKARTLIDLYKNSGLGVESQENKTAVKKAFRHWFKKFYTLLDDYSKEGLLPHVLIVNAHKEIKPWFTELLMSEDALREHMHTQGRIELVELPLRESDSKVIHTFSDPGLGIVSAYIGQEEK